ncbi:hypothetical protein Tco_0955935 [Tanacetum coccineum]|uniref:Uncharacterized protein n=1 Tax=Tanacetum coccineum TaxID=301880 RepID=A0ABQ5E8K0_9ASTR
MHIIKDGRFSSVALAGSIEKVDDVWSPSEHPEKKHNEETSANLTRAEPGEYSREAGVSKDTPGPESPGELQRSWYVKGHLGYEGVSSGEAKLTHIFTKIETKNKADSQSPDEEVKGINSNSRVTGPRKGSAVPFSLYPHHPPSTFISKEKNMLKTRREKPNEKLEFQRKPHPLPVSKHTPSFVVQQEGYDRTNGSNRKRNDASRK